MKTRFTLAAIIAAGAATAFANAEMFQGQTVAITGNCWFNAPAVGAPDTGWGTGYQQGPHFLGGQSVYTDAVYGPTYQVVVSSFVNSPFSTTFVIDFSTFFPADFNFMTIDIVGLKSDHSLAGAEGNLPGFSTDGNVIHWEGSGDDIAALAGSSLVFKVFQTPGPGAFALLGLAGMTGSRRRRA